MMSSQLKVGPAAPPFPTNADTFTTTGLPSKSFSDAYSCPVCGAPKRRFKAYEPAVSKNWNEKEVRKARKALIQRDEAIGRSLPIGIALGVVGLAGFFVCWIILVNIFVVLGISHKTQVFVPSIIH